MQLFCVRERKRRGKEAGAQREESNNKTGTSSQAICQKEKESSSRKFNKFHLHMAEGTACTGGEG